MSRIRERIAAAAPWPARYVYRKLRAFPQDVPYLWKFLASKTKTPVSLRERLWLIGKCYRISYSVDCPHMEYEMIEVMRAIFDADPNVSGAVVEAGSYKGGSGAKISLAAAIAGRKLYLFDSFEGIPEHAERHTKNIFGGDAYFPPGSYFGSLEEVKRTIARHGKISQCEFVKGWFDDTMPKFREPVAVAYVDVDLESSTRTCLRYLFPRLVSGGVLFSQDGHLPWVVKLLRDTAFWKKALKTERPRMHGLGFRKLVKIVKP